MGIKMNFEEYRGALQRLRDRSRDECSKAVEEHMREVVLPETLIQVPKATGALEGTAEVRPGKRQGGWEVHYGNSPVNDRSMVDYAAAVHEIESHKHMPPTKVKFVEDPLKELLPALKERAGKKLDDLAQG